MYMVFSFIFYLILIAVFCAPVTFRVKAFAGGRTVTMRPVISINGIDFFPGKRVDEKSTNEPSPRKSRFPYVIKFVPNRFMLKLINIYELKVTCYNVSEYSVIAYNAVLSIFGLIASYLRYSDKLHSYTVDTFSGIGRPEIQVRLHIKLNLFMIFSAVFKIIKLEKRRAYED